MADRVRVLSATVENFGSVARADYGLDALGLVLVEGRNLDDPRTPSNGCLSGDTLIDCPRDLRRFPRGIPIRDLVGTTPWVYAWHEGRIVVRQASRVWRTKRAPTVRVQLSKYADTLSGPPAGEFLPPQELVGTADHLVRLVDGTWRPLGQLRPGDRLCSMYRRKSGGWRTLIYWTGSGEMPMGSRRGRRTVSEQQFVCTEIHGPRGSDDEAHHLDGNEFNHSVENLEWKNRQEHQRDHLSQRRWAKVRPPVNHIVLSVEPGPEIDVYDMTVPGADSFVANGVVVHNSGKSTLFLDAPTWALFGEARAGAADDVVNDRAGRGCAVTVRLDVPGTGLISIQRFRKVAGKNGLRLWLGQDVRDLAAAKTTTTGEVSSLDVTATQRQIEDLLGLDLEVWRSAVYRAQDDEARFADLKDSAQKARLTKVFQLDVIDQWREHAAECVKARGLERTQVVFDLQQLNASGLTDRARQLTQAKASWEQQHQARLAQLSAELADRRVRYQEVQQRVARAGELAQERQTLLANPPQEPEAPRLPPRPPETHLPPGPPPPSPPEPMAPYQAPPAPEMPAGEDPRLIEAEQLAVLAATAAAQAAEWARQAVGFHERAEVIRARRSGRCAECGGELSPKHADREAARLAAEELPLARAASQTQRRADEAQAKAAALRQEVQRTREDHQRAVAAWRGQCSVEQARLAAEQQRRQALYQEQYQQHQRAEQLRRQAHEQQQRQGWEVWQAQCAAIQQEHQRRVAAIRGDYDARLAALTAEVSTFESARRDLEREAEQGRRLRGQHDVVAAERWDLEQELLRVEQELAQLQPRRLELEQRLAGVEQQLRLAEFWVEGFGPRGLKAFVLDERVQELTDRANHWLRILTGGVYWVRFETQTATQAGKLTDRFATRVFRHRRAGGIAERHWNQWSGGQRGRVGIAIDLALADAVAARAQRSYDLLVLDEVFRHLDAGGRETVLEALLQLRQERGSVVVVDHDPQFRAAFERRIVVELKDETSAIVESA